MSRIPSRWRKALLATAAGVVSVSAAGWAAGQLRPLTSVAPPPTPVGLLTQPIPNTAPNAEQLRRGQYLVRAGDCVSCHLGNSGQALAGGLGLKTPFGTIYSSNITPDRDTGIGAWTSDQFYRAMHDGVGAHGENLYPALPYPWFRAATRTDDDAILAYLKTTPAIRYTPPSNRLPFPLNLRFMVKGWNLLFLHTQDFKPDPNQSPEWNRGSYLVNGYAHCGGCHTPKNMFGADRSGKAFRGGDLDNWVAPDLTSNARTGLGGWSVADVTDYLKTGRNIHAGAGGAMAEVVTYSTSLMSDQDRRAIAVYLKSLPSSPATQAPAPDPSAMKRGAEIYSDACASCHLENGIGQPTYFPPLRRNPMLQQSDAAGLEHLILAGSRVGASPTRPSPLTMPSFAWKLTDQEVADVSTFLRNSWGNHAAPVEAGKVSAMRRTLGLDKPRLTANSGDRN